ncbi:MAG TPA: 3-methyl-2-oxobutanoate hydroxymethyltransferase, partial [Acidimicrobiales bacterium]|nr:3-methyl-2-oxobutanoate hydroxymethyltransferase [Acidimicrobiales bacterium]
PLAATSALDGKGATMPDKMTAPAVRARKRREGHDPLVMITAYDTPSARIADDAGVDMILVGDSVANNVLGYADTLGVTIDDMAHHVAAVARAKPNALVVGDMPWMSYHVSPAESLVNAATLIRAGAGCVKLEGGRKRLPAVQAIVDAEIPVMGHLGLTPQSVHAMGGYKVQGREATGAAELEIDAKSLVEAGCFAIVLEGVPDLLAERITEAVEVPTIGIGAGAGCDGQVLVFHDLLGFNEQTAKFVRRYADLGTAARDAVRAWSADVRAGTFPGDAETYHASSALREALGET